MSLTETGVAITSNFRSWFTKAYRVLPLASSVFATDTPRTALIQFKKQLAFVVSLNILQVFVVSNFWTGL